VIYEQHPSILVCLTKEESVEEIMRYQTIAKQIKVIDSQETEKRFGADRMLRFLGNLICPICIQIGLSANQVSYLGLFITSCSAFILLSDVGETLTLGVSIYLFAIVLDYCDGTIARYHDVANFYGRFIDGLFDILNNAMFNVAIVFYIFNHFDLPPIVQVLCLMALPMAVVGSLVMDRYSTMTRWIKETQNIELKPTIKGEFPKFLFSYFYDVRILSITSMLIFEISSIVYLLVFLFINSLVTIFHIAVGAQTLNHSAKSHRVR
jgi:phosphatidylglycerophosphate synthase